MRTAFLAAGTAALSLALVAPGIASAACTTQNTYKANTTGEWQLDANWSTGTARPARRTPASRRPRRSSSPSRASRPPTSSTVEGTLRFRTDPGFQVDPGQLRGRRQLGPDRVHLDRQPERRVGADDRRRQEAHQPRHPAHRATNTGRVVIYGDVDNAAGGSLQVNSKLTVVSLSQAVKWTQRRRRHRRVRHRAAVRQRARFDVRADRGHVHQQRRNDLQPVHRPAEGHGRHVLGHAAAAAPGLARAHGWLRHGAHPVRQRDAGQRRRQRLDHPPRRSRQRHDAPEDPGERHPHQRGHDRLREGPGRDHQCRGLDHRHRRRRQAHQHAARSAPTPTPPARRRSPPRPTHRTRTTRTRRRSSRTVRCRSTTTSPRPVHPEQRDDHGGHRQGARRGQLHLRLRPGLRARGRHGDRQRPRVRADGDQLRRCRRPDARWRHEPQLLLGQQRRIPQWPLRPDRGRHAADRLAATGSA